MIAFIYWLSVIRDDNSYCQGGICADSRHELIHLIDLLNFGGVHRWYNIFHPRLLWPWLRDRASRESFHFIISNFKYFLVKILVINNLMNNIAEFTPQTHKSIFNSAYKLLLWPCFTEKIEIYSLQCPETKRRQIWKLNRTKLTKKVLTHCTRWN